MAVTNLYSNLPGHLVEFKDGGLQLTSSTTDTSSTKSLLILGTATDGPVNEPVKIDAVTVSQVFGKEVNEDGYPNGATLTKYAKQAFKNGFDDVRCMRVTGSQAYTTIDGQSVIRYETVPKTVVGRNNNGKLNGLPEVTFVYRDDNGNLVNVAAIGGESTLDINTNYVLNDNEYLCALKDVYYTDDDISADAPEAKDLIGQGIGWHPYQGFTTLGNYRFGYQNGILHCKKIKFTNSNKYVSVDSTDNLSTLADSTDETVNVSFTIPNNGTVIKLFTDKLGSTDGTDQLGLPDVYGTDFKVDDDGVSYGIKFESDSGTGTPVTIIPQSINIDDTNGDIVCTIEVEPSVLSGVNRMTATAYPYEEEDTNINLDDLFEDTGITLDSSVIVLTEDLPTSDEEKQSITVEVGSGDTKVSIPNSGLEIDDTVNGRISIKIKESVIKTLSSGFVNGYATVYYNYKQPVTEGIQLKVKSQFGGSIYKDGTVQVVKTTEGSNTYKEIIFTKPSAKQTTAATRSYSYSSKYYQTVDDLILAMKNDVNNLNMFDIEIIEGEGTTPIDLLTEFDTPKALDQGGEDGIKPTNDEMFVALSGERYKIGDTINGNPITSDMVGYLKTQGAYQILENYNVDYIYPAGIYADSKSSIAEANHTDFQRELALVCAVLTYRTKMTHGFIDVKPNSNTTLVGIDAYVAKLLNGRDNIYYMTDQNGDIIYDSENKPMDIGWYTSVVVGPEVVMTSDTLGTYYGSPAIAYAALNSVLEPQSSPLNKAIRNVNGMKFKFSNKQADALIGGRYVCFKLKNEGLATASSTPYVVDGITAGAPGCDYANFVTVKVVTDVVDNIRQVADPFIGEQNTTEQRNALSALISKRLAKLVEAGEIQSYEFEISATIQQQLLGEASIALTIVPAMTLKKITTVVALRAAE